MTPTAVVLVAHGTVESLDDLPEFLTNIRRGRPAPPELAAEMRRRYEAIGGQSPLNAINRDVAAKLEAKLGIPVRMSNRLFRPYPKDVIAELAREGVRRIVTVPLAQHSASIYGSSVIAAAKEVDPSLEVVAAPNWGSTPTLVAAYADKVLDAMKSAPPGATVVFTAHSLPLVVIRGGDAYETEFRASVDAVVAAIRARGAAIEDWEIAFQSGGTPASDWLGPDLETVLRRLAEAGKRDIVLAPIGFLADHVEILYDLDIEAKISYGGKLGIVIYRSASLNAEDALIEALANVVRSLAAW